MKRSLLNITVLLLSIMLCPIQAFAINTLVNTSGTTTISDTGAGTDVNLVFGGTVAKTFSWDANGGSASDGAYTFDDEITVTGTVNTSGYYEMDGTPVLSDNGTDNWFVGPGAGESLSTGYSNLYIGNDAGKDTNSGYNNMFIGTSAGENITVEHDNTFIGANAGLNASAGNHNLFIGSNAGYQNTGAQNVFVGQDSGHNNTSGYGNTYLGRNTGYSNTTSIHRTLLGYNSGYYNTGTNNTFVGSYSAYNSGSGIRNVTVGDYASYANTGSNNVIIGHEAGYSGDGSSNVFLGYQAGYSETGSNKLYIDNSNTSSPLIHGDFDTNDITINGDLATTGTIDGTNTEWDTAYTHSQTTTGNPHAVSLDDSYDSGVSITVDSGPLDLNVTGINKSELKGIDLDLTTMDEMADFYMDYRAGSKDSINLDDFTITRRVDAGNYPIPNSGNVLKVVNTIDNGGDATDTVTNLFLDKSRWAYGDFIKGDYDRTEVFSIEYDGDITTTGDLNVNGDDINADGDLSIEAGGDQIYIGSSNSGNVDLIVRDGGTCFGSGGCNAPTADGYVNVEGRLSIGYTGTPSAEAPLDISGGVNDDAILIDNNKWYSAETTVGTNIRLSGISSGNHVYLGAIDSTGGNVYIREDGSNTITLSGQNASFAGDITTASGRGYKYNSSTTLNNTIPVSPGNQSTWPLELVAQDDQDWELLDLTSYTSSTANGVYICTYTQDNMATNSNPASTRVREYGLTSPDWRDIAFESYISTNGTGTWDTVCGLVKMDSQQRIEYQLDAASGSSLSFFLLVNGYVEPTT